MDSYPETLIDPVFKLFYKLCVRMHGNKAKFECNSSLEYYHMTYWENKTYKLMRSIVNVDSHNYLFSKIVTA